MKTYLCPSFVSRLNQIIRNYIHNMYITKCNNNNNINENRSDVRGRG